MTVCSTRAGTRPSWDAWQSGRSCIFWNQRPHHHEAPAGLWHSDSRWHLGLVDICFFVRRSFHEVLSFCIGLLMGACHWFLIMVLHCYWKHVIADAACRFVLSQLGSFTSARTESKLFQVVQQPHMIHIVSGFWVSFAMQWVCVMEEMCCLVALKAEFAGLSVLCLAAFLGLWISWQIPSLSSPIWKVDLKDVWTAC